MAKKSKPTPPASPAKKPKSAAALRRRTRMIALEPRMLFDGALGIDLGAKTTALLRGDTSFDAADPAPTPAAPEPQRAEGNEKSAAKVVEKAAEKTIEALEKLPGAERKELVFVDTSVEDYQELLKDLNPNAKVVLLDPARDGVKQILDALENESDVGAIHIVSHGSSGQLQLGTSILDATTMRTQFAEQLSKIGTHLSAEADILVYGCDFGKSDAGEEAAMRLAYLTGADVAASDDVTGHKELGGDWDLEVAFGKIETDVAFGERAQQAFKHVLATIDWDTETWTDATGTVYTGVYSVGGANVTVTINDAGNDFQTAPTINSTDASGGLTPAQDGLSLYANFDAQGAIGGEVITMTLDFAHAGGVSNVAFTIFDIDTGGFIDRIRVTGNNGAVIDPTTISFAAGTTVSQVNSNTVVGTAGVGATSSAGNATFTFNQTGITQITIEYLSGQTADPSQQRIVLHDISFDAPPTGAPIVDLDANTVPQALDQFANQAYNNASSGAIAWGGNWTESDATQSATADNVRVVDDIGTGNYELRLRTANQWAQRAIDLSAYSTDSVNRLSFNYRTSANVDAGDLLNVQISTNGGGSWTTIGTLDVGANANGTASYDISQYSGANTVVRVGTGANWAGTESFYVDTFEITAQQTAYATTYTEDGAAVNVSAADAQVLDNNANMSGAVVTITDYVAGDVLAATVGATGISASYAGGVLTLSGSSTRANYETVLRTVTYASTSNNPTVGGTDTTRTLNVVVTDSAANASNTARATINLVAVNDAPVLADTALTLTVAEDAAAPVGAVGSLLSSFTGGITEPDGGTTRGIAITASNETNGTWYYSVNGGTNWTAVGTVSAAQSLLLADNANTRLYFAPSTNYNGTASSALTVRAWDQTSGTAGTKVSTATTGGTTAFSAATDVIDVSVTPVNDAPVLADTALTLTVAEDAGAPVGAVGALVSAYTGGITEPDGGATRGIAITTSNETNGIWYYSVNGGTNWTAVGVVSTAQSLLLADNANTRLYFAPNANYNGASAGALTIRAWDQSSGAAATKVSTATTGGITAFSTATDVIDVSVTAVNDAPTLADTVLTLGAVNEDAGAPSGAVGTLVSTLVGGQADVDASASQGIAITAADSTNGTWHYSINGGTSWNALGAVAGNSARLLAADANTRVYFQPTANYNGTVATGITFRAWDQTNGSNGAAADTTTNGGTTAFSTATDTAAITVNAVNDAPVLADTALTLTVAEDAGVPSGAVGSLVSAYTGGITEPDGGATRGIALTASNETNGTWYYSTNGGASWTAVGTVSAAQSLLLADDASTRLYFAPGANYNGTSASALTIRAWDQTSGSAGTKVSTATTGGITAFSSATDVVDVSVTAVNDAPTLADTVLTLGAVNEDAGAPSGAVGTLVSTLVGGQADVDSGASQGIAITAADTANGTWYYSINGGTSWNALGAVANNSARLLAADANTRVYFQPTANYNGTVATGITFRSWDQTSGSNGATADASTNGGTTAFSSATDTAAITVNAVNDAPVLADTALTLAVGEDAGVPAGAVGSLVSAYTGGITEPDGGATRGIAITASNETNGAWYYSTNGGGSWTAVGTVNAANSLLLADNASTRLYFAPNANYNGASASALTIRAWDQSAGTAGTKVSTATTGGTTAFSTATDVIDVSVTAVNDAPTLADTVLTLGAVNEDAAAPSGAVGTLVSTLVGGQADVDASASQGIAITAADATNGTWYYSINGGTSWNALGAVAGNSARLLAADANTRVYFQPTVNYNGTVATGITFRAWDQTSGSNGATADTTTNGGATAFSTATDTAAITVNAVNDAPVLADTSLSLTVLEDAGVPSGAVGSLVSAYTGGITEPDGSATRGIAIVSSNETNGTWYYSTNAGASWTAVGTVSAAQ
jgi:hypothetical protein